MILWSTVAGSGSALGEAWRLSKAFGTQTLAAFARHPGIILLYAAPPATIRAWILLQVEPRKAWRLPWLEAFVAIWRLFMCVIAGWAVLTPDQMRNLQTTLTSNALFQAKLDHVGEIMGKQLWLVSWEVVICVAAFCLLNWLLSTAARLWVRGQDLEPEQKKRQRLALTSVARNLLLIPLAMIYGVVLIRNVLA